MHESLVPKCRNHGYPWIRGYVDTSLTVTLTPRDFEAYLPVLVRYIPRVFLSLGLEILRNIDPWKGHVTQ